MELIKDVIGKTYYQETATRDAGIILYEILPANMAVKLSMITNWRRNRPPDPTRIDEIARDIASRGCCDGELLLAMVPHFGCVCYDGSHRLEACRRVFPRNGIRLRILLNSNESEIEGEFKRINKGVPVPELYFSQEETDTYLREQIQRFIDDYLVRDARVVTHISTSKHPKRPNFNKDVLAQQIGEYIADFFTAENGLGKSDIYSVVNAAALNGWFNDMNEYARYQIETSQLENSMTEKCKKTGWFLFYYDWRNTIAKTIKLYVK